MKFIFVVLFVLSSVSFAKDVLQPGIVHKLSEQKLLDKLRVYLAHRTVVVREFNRVSNTDVNDGDVTNSLSRVVEKTVITKRIKGKIIETNLDRYGREILYVSFDPKCTVAACTYQFEYDLSDTKGYGLGRIPAVEGSQLIDAYTGFTNGPHDRPDSKHHSRRVKLEFSQNELNQTIKRTVRPSGFDVE